MTHVFFAIALMACGGGTTAPNANTPAPDAAAAPAPDAAPAPEGSGDPMAGACKKVVTSEDANAIYLVLRNLENQGDCTFEDVGVEGSTITLAFETKDKTKATSTLRPVDCVKERNETQITGGPWILDLPPESKKLCPVGYESLTEVLVGAKLPPPTDAK